MCWQPAVRTAASISRPMGPQPWISTRERKLSNPVAFARSSACTTTAAGSISMRRFVLMSLTTKKVESRRTMMYSSNTY